MERQIFVVNAEQVVISDAHPEGLYSVMSGYPKVYDSRSYNATEENPNGDASLALNAAKSEYFSRLSAIYVGSATRVMATVSLMRTDGRLLMSEHIGKFPDVTPVPEPEQEPEEEPEQ